MSNMYWAGVLPGLFSGTFLSVGVVRSLPHNKEAFAHVLWLVPGLHLVGAFILGPALALAYGLALLPWAAALAPWLWVGGASFLGLIFGLLIWRKVNRRRGTWVGIVAGIVIFDGWLLVPLYHLLVA